jgi:hypothetical protein
MAPDASVVTGSVMALVGGPVSRRKRVHLQLTTGSLKPTLAVNQIAQERRAWYQRTFALEGS